MTETKRIVIKPGVHGAMTTESPWCKHGIDRTGKCAECKVELLITTIESQKEEINRLMGVNQHLEIDLSESKAITELAVKGLEHYAEWIDWEDDSMGDKARSTLSEIEVLSQ